MVNSLNRAVITGIGAVSPNGIGKDQFWEGLKNGKNCVDRITFFDPSNHPSQMAAEILDFDPKAFVPYKEVKRMGRAAQLIVAASLLAIEDANLAITSSLKAKTGVIVGTGASGIEYAEEDFYSMSEGGVRKMRPYAAIAGFSGALSSEISRALGLKRFSITISTGCTGSSDAIGFALHAIRSGTTKMLLTGGSDACVTPGILGAFCQMGATCMGFNDNPTKASRPFNRDRSGFVIAEGAWVFVAEELSHALRRNAKIYGEIAGYGATCDAYHMSRPDPSGKHTANAMRLALVDAHMSASEMEFIAAYGNATAINDSYETMVIKKVFGEYAYKIPVSSVKSMLGHPIGSSGAQNVAAALMTFNEDILPPTINYENPDPMCDLDYVPNYSREQKVSTAMSNTLAFGAKNSVLILKKYPSNGF